MLFGAGAILGTDGQPVPVPSYFATMWVGDRAHCICVLGYGESSYVGRDVLDQLCVTLDGVNQRLVVSSTAPGE